MVVVFSSLQLLVVEHPIPRVRLGFPSGQSFFPVHAWLATSEWKGNRAERGPAWWGPLAAGARVGLGEHNAARSRERRAPPGVPGHGRQPRRVTRPGARRTWPHVTGHVGRAEAWLGWTGSISAPGWALVERWLARHSSLCWCWDGRRKRRGREKPGCMFCPLCDCEQKLFVPEKTMHANRRACSLCWCVVKK
jgi:hypothetical protein